MLAMSRFHPRLLEELRSYDGAKFLSDLSAGLTVAAVALPLAMAFAIASGLKPEAGLFTAIVAGFLISALGGSRVQIGGPAGAFVVVVYAIVVRFVPVTIVIGFTNGIAVIIILSQLPEFLGLKVDQLPADFVLKLRVLAGAAPTADAV